MDFRFGTGTRYHALANVIRQRIAAGVYRRGEQLPTEQQLSDTFGCGRDMVRDALQVLRSEDLIVTERGRRTTVVARPKLTEIVVPVGTTVMARMPMQPELATLGCRASTPLLVVTPPGEQSTVYPADRTAVTAARPAAPGLGNQLERSVAPR